MKKRVILSCPELLVGLLADLKPVLLFWTDPERMRPWPTSIKKRRRTDTRSSSNSSKLITPNFFSGQESFGQRHWGNACFKHTANLKIIPKATSLKAKSEVLTSNCFFTGC